MSPLTESQQALAEEAADRADAIAQRYARIFPEHRDDFESAAKFGAVRAAASYVPELGGVWERWSRVRIRGEIKDFLRSSYLKHQRLWEQESLETLVDQGSWTDDHDRFDVGMDYGQILALLPDKHRRLCELVYSVGMTAGDAGVAMGYSQNYGYKLHKEALAILRENLAA